MADLRALFAAFVDEQAERGAYDPALAADFRERGGRAVEEAIRAAEEGDTPSEEPAA